MNGQSASNITHGTWLMLKITYGLVGIAAGADKFLNVITHWEKYVSPSIAQHIPMGLSNFMYLIGIVEIVVGIMILTKFTRLGAYLMASWLVIIVANLLTMDGMYYDIAVRDIVMAVGALALAQLTLVHEKA